MDFEHMMIMHWLKPYVLTAYDSTNDSVAEDEKVITEQVGTNYVLVMNR